MNPTFVADQAALVLVDFQVGTMQLIKNIPVELVRANAISLARMARILDMPVVLTSSVEDQVQGPMIPELEPIHPQAFADRIKRVGIVNAWNDPDFKAAIEATGKKQLIMAGVTTDVCLVYPAISAVQAGYDVQAVMDASGSPFDLSEEMVRRRMQQEGVVLTATNTLIAELAQSWASETGSQLAQILFQDILPPIDAAVSKKAADGGGFG